MEKKKTFINNICSTMDILRSKLGFQICYWKNSRGSGSFAICFKLEVMAVMAVHSLKKVFFLQC